jgi:hypothetical protein
MSEKIEFPIPEIRFYKRLSIPNPKIFEMDVPLLFYHGRIFQLTENQTDENYMKVFDSMLGFQEIGLHSTYEKEYFEDYARILDEVKKNFVKSLLAGTTKEERKSFHSVGTCALKKIEEYYLTLITKDRRMPYVGKGRITELCDSLFSRLNGYERILMLDEKLYDLLTIPEFLKKFKNVFEPKFFIELQKMAANSDPEEVSKYITNNVDRMNEKALPLVRNKIWHSRRSCKLFFDGVYFIPEFRGSSMVLLDRYKGLFESKIKSEAISEYLISELVL